MHHPGRRRTSDESSQHSSQGSVEINMTQVSSNNDPPIISSYRQAGTTTNTHNNVNNRGIFLPTSRIRNNPHHMSGQIRNNGHNNNQYQAGPTLHHNTQGTTTTNGQQPFMNVTAKYYNDDDDDDTEALDSRQTNERIPQHYSTAYPSTNNNYNSFQQQGNRMYIITALLLGTFIIFSGSNISQSIINTSFDLVSLIPGISHIIKLPNHRDLSDSDNGGTSSQEEILLGSQRPEFVYEHPYVSSSYYTSTNSLETLVATRDNQVMKNLAAAEAANNYNDDDTNVNEMKTRLAIVRPFCEFDAEALPTTFTCWNALPPCKAASDDIGDEVEEQYEVDNYGELVSYNTNTTNGRNLHNQATIGDRHLFDLVGSDAMKSAKADVFLFYSQTFSENDVAIKAVDAIIDKFFEPGGWSQCFGNIYAIEANIPQELDLYIPSAQEELYNWVNGPNRQFEAAFRIIQSGEWGEYDGFYLMEGDSVPIKAHWLDVVLSEIEVNRPFAILGA